MVHNPIIMDSTAPNLNQFINLGFGATIDGARIEKMNLIDIIISNLMGSNTRFFL